MRRWKALLVGGTVWSALSASGPVPVGGPPPGPRTVAAVQELLAAQRFDVAARLGLAVLDDVAAEHGPDSLETVEVLIPLVKARVAAGGEFIGPECEVLARRAVTITARHLGEGHPLHAASLCALARTLIVDVRPREGKPLLLRALAIAERALGKDHPEVADVLLDLSAAEGSLGDEGTARTLAERALTIRTRALGPRHRDTADALRRVARSTFFTGDYLAAETLAERALEIQVATLGADHADVGDTEDVLGIVRMGLGDYLAARRDFERTLAIRQGMQHTNVGSAQHNLCLVLLKLGEHAEVWRRTEDLRRIETRYHLSVLNGWRTRAEAAMGLGKHAEAERILRRVVVLRERGLGPDHQLLASALQFLASALAPQGKDAEARACLERARAMFQRTLAPGHPRVAGCSEDLGRLLQRVGDLTGAGAALRDALVLRERVVGPSHPDVARTRQRLAEVAWSAGDAAGALAEAVRAEAIVRAHLVRMAGGLSEREALDYEALRGTGLGVALSVLATGRADDDDVEKVLDQLVRSRALVLDEIARRHRRALDGGSPELAALSGDLERARMRLARWVVAGAVQGDAGRYGTRLRELEADKERTERRLAERSAAFRTNRDFERVGLEEIRAALPRDGVLVSYVRYGRLLPGEPPEPRGAYGAFVLRAGAQRAAFVPLGAAEPIERLVAGWRTASGAPAPDRAALTAYRSLAGRLRERVWDPLAAHLRGAAAVWVVPDGTLHLVNLGTLPTTGARYLVEDGPLLHLLSAERDLVPPRTRTLLGRGLLVVGGAGFEGEALAPLPGSRAEAEEVASRWTSGDVLRLVGASATERDFRRLAPGRRVLHLATHTFLRDACEREARCNPLLSSGLTFAAGARAAADEAEAGADDGVLTAEEVASLDLRGVEWAVLSGCETGVGPVQTGEGVLGVRRAFRVAGVRTLVMSLWPVEDQPARAWIGALYEGRRANLAAAAAARRASLDVLAARREAGVLDDPFHWGAFVVAD